MLPPKRIDINANISHLETCNTSSTNHGIHVPSFEGSYNDFFNQFLLPNQPVIIHKVTSDWKCTKLWVKDGLPDIDYLRTQYGDALVSVAHCNEKYFNAQRTSTMTFQNFANYWEKLLQNGCRKTEPCLYLKDWHFTRDFPEDNVYVVPAQFCSDWLNEYFTSNIDLNDDYRFVYMGPEGSWTPFHVDVFTSFSWSVNVCGEKYWILLEPGEENKLKDKLGNLPYDITFLKESNKDSNNNDNNIKLKYKIIIQKPGDAVFVPSGWYHQVWNMQHTISINHNWVNGCSIKNMWKAMKNNFDEVKNEIAEFQNVMDDWDSHCQLLLKSSFGMNFKDFHHFIKFILQRRKRHVENKIELQVYGDWFLGLNHVECDFFAAKAICDIFDNDPDVRMLFDGALPTSD